MKFNHTLQILLTGLQCVVLLCTAFLIISCSKDDNSPTEPTNSIPTNPFNPAPPDSASDQSIDVNLNWSCSDPDGDDLTYDIYFGSSDNPQIVSEGQADTLYNPDELDYSQTYYWKIVAKDDHDNSIEGQIWWFTTIANQPPMSPFNSSPSDSALDQSIAVNLSWSCSDPESDPLTYIIYFGSSDNPQIVSEGQADTLYKPDELDYSQTYYWKIVAKDNQNNSTEGPMWSFTTLNGPPLPPSDPNPENGSEDLDIDITLNWSCSDPDGDPLIYDVYFGNSDNPPLVYLDQEENRFNPEEMTFRETYYWKIVARDDHGNSAESPTWIFSTISEREFNLTDDVSITMVWIPSGEFEMGSPNGEQDSDDDEGPVHSVTFSDGFWLGKYEVTQAQWEAVMGDNPSRNDGENRPVERVSWNDIQEFEFDLDDDFRLPSESEWEYACRAGTDTRFYWSDDPDYEEIDDYAWYYYNSNSRAHDVGQKQPNSYGLYDMSGNVYEWCEDWHHSNYNDAPDDGSAWISPSGSYRVYRGGCWDGAAVYSRSANRKYLVAPSSRSNRIGLRLARSL